MTNLEKWKKKLAEAKDGFELLDTIDEMTKTHTTNMCFSVGIKICNQYADCEECKAKWLDKEAEEIEK